MQKKIQKVPHIVFAEEARLNSNDISSSPVNIVLSQ